MSKKLTAEDIAALRQHARWAGSVALRDFDRLVARAEAAEAQVTALTKRVVEVEAQVSAQQVLDWMEARKGTSWKASIGDVEKVMNAIKFEREERATLSTPKEGGALCDGCPPADYDAPTRCLPCPRRTPKEGGGNGG